MDEVTRAVAEAIKRHLMTRTAPTLGATEHDLARIAVETLAAQGDITDEQIKEAVVLPLAESFTSKSGDVKYIALDGSEPDRYTDHNMGWAKQESRNFPPAVRALLARQAAVHATREAELADRGVDMEQRYNAACEERDEAQSEVTALRVENAELLAQKALTDRLTSNPVYVAALAKADAHDKCERERLAVVVERDALRATVERVRAEIEHAESNGQVLSGSCQGVGPGETVPAVRISYLRAALADPKGDGA